VTLGVGDDHAALHDTVRRWSADRCPAAVPRAFLDGAPEQPPPFWEELASLGWLGLHLPERDGGEGYGLLEAAVVTEALGEACAPGPFVPTVVASAVIDRWGDDDLRARLPAMARGELVAAVDGLGAATAHVLLHRTDEGWSVFERDEVDVAERANVDETRRVADVVPRSGRDGRRLDAPPGAIDDLLAALLAAEACGVAAWCVDTAASYARVREQFGRPIGQFQGVKHRCADMLCALELARAAAWDAVRGDDVDPLAAAAAAALAPDAALRCAKDCVQVLGGIGFTWEHDAHLYLRRAMALRALAGTAAGWRARAASLVRGGHRRTLAVALPPEADAHRTEVRAFVDRLRQRETGEWRAALADEGYLAPHWPSPWGRDASAIEQLVIDDELRQAGVRRPHLQVGAWVLPTLIAHGSVAQQERFVPPTLRGEITWCQLFSEPGAGSDLASLSTKASRADGGWVLTGQKVWTTMAAESDYGLCLARTGSSAARHDGITCFVVDMRSAGIDIRPLRELTGQAMFNEVFLSDVFVPDDCVVGEVDDGWRLARTTLANERVSMGSGSSFGLGEEALVALTDEVDDEVAALLVEAHALAVLGLRMTARAVAGGQPGPEASVRKLLGVEHDQRVQEVGWRLLGRAGALADGPASTWANGFLANRCLTIAGGTSEVQRNVIAERLLGLPRDP
jgi:alkylation response protein AidB-like acyl-CoA dehydrogenase